MKPAEGESVAQSKSTRCRKPELSTMERGHYMDDWPLRDRLLPGPEISPQSDSLQALQKSFRWDYKPRSFVCIRMQKERIRTLKILQSMSEFGALWKHQNNPARTNGVRVFIMSKLDIIRKKIKKEMFAYILHFQANFSLLFRPPLKCWPEECKPLTGTFIKACTRSGYDVKFHPLRARQTGN